MGKISDTSTYPIQSSVNSQDYIVGTKSTTLETVNFPVSLLQTGGLSSLLSGAAASLSINTITFTRENGETFDVTLLTSAPIAPPPVIPDLPPGSLVSLQTEVWDPSSGFFPGSGNAQAGYL